jgi:hypothetical protein
MGRFSVNITEAVLDCVCIDVKGDSRLQPARQLIAAALNCLTSGGGDCTGTGIYTDVFTNCNATCTNPSASSRTSPPASAGLPQQWRHVRLRHLHGGRLQ